MTSGVLQRRSRWTRSPGRRAGRGPVMRWLARIGFTARGLLYGLIGAIAIAVAFDHSRRAADGSGALRLLARTPLGAAALWLLAAGFAALALWRLAEARYGHAAERQGRARNQLADLFSAVVYGFVCYGTLKYALGLRAPTSSDSQSVDLTAKAMRYPGGRAIVAAAGVALIGAGVILAYRAWTLKFRSQLDLGRMSPRTRRVVERLGQAGGAARGIVFAVAGGFLLVAGLDAKPRQAKGLDSTLRAFAATPLGPWLLVLVAAGLVTFGAYSCCEARWRTR